MSDIVGVVMALGFMVLASAGVLFIGLNLAAETIARAIRGEEG